MNTRQIPQDLFDMAYTYFEDENATEQWFYTENIALGLVTPISICNTKEGGERIKQVINKLKFGMTA
ncbi:MbcA/ParS/Xre antitoxin family protein [Photobacterium sagamiensis]|uniref:antitoxin Xre/MbcA/ParS toxin-binding domain-containing protein n=1 Tax=Photobacterium sagamiensis TaxID=2910241 RepID=UPI003D0E040B